MEVCSVTLTIVTFFHSILQHLLLPAKVAKVSCTWVKEKKELLNLIYMCHYQFVPVYGEFWTEDLVGAGLQMILPLPVHEETE